MNPVQQMTPMALLHLTTRITQRDMGLLSLPQASAFFVQEGVGGHGERLKANNVRSGHQLVPVQSQ